MTDYMRARVAKAIETIADAATRVLLDDDYDDQDLVKLECAFWLLLGEVRKKN